MDAANGGQATEPQIGHFALVPLCTTDSDSTVLALPDLDYNPSYFLLKYL